jgi:hypothetical protein
MASSQRGGRPPRTGRRGGPQESDDRRIRRVREQSSPAKKWIALIFLGIGLLAIAGVAVAYWYTQLYRPPNVEAAVVNDTRFSQGDLVKRVRMIQAGQGYTGAFVDLTSILRVLYNPDIEITSGPFTLGWVQMELLKQGAPEYGVEVTEDIIDETIQFIFCPTPAPGEIVTEDQQERECMEQYESYLNRNRISDADFRRIMEERLYFFDMREAIGANVATEEEHLEVSWIRTPVRPDPSLGDPTRWQDLGAIVERLEKEEFEAVAYEFSPAFDSRYTDSTGYVGWLPKGAFPRLDPHLFGDDEFEPLEIGEISDPWESSGYMYFMKVTDGPEVRAVEEKWTDRLKDIALQSWLEDRFEVGTSEEWVRVKYDSKIYAWAAEQLRQTAQQKRGDTQGNEGN